MNNKNAVILLDGIFPKRSLLKSILNTKPYLICADGAANKLFKTKVIPDIIIGDLDSIEPDIMLKYIKKNVPVMKIFDQETTDFEKCILYCEEHNFSNITVIGVIGDRTDHNLNNFSVVKRHHERLNITLYDEHLKINFIKNSVSFKYKPGEIVSLLPFPKAENITTDGLLYPLRNESLQLGVREGTLNFATKSNIKIKFGKGDLILFIKHFL